MNYVHAPILVNDDGVGPHRPAVCGARFAAF